MKPRTPHRPGRRAKAGEGRRGSLPQSRCFVRYLEDHQSRGRKRTEGAGGDGDVKGSGGRAGRGEPRRTAAQTELAQGRSGSRPDPTRRETVTPMHLGQSCRACGVARLPRAKVTQQRRAVAISPEKGTERTAGSALTRQGQGPGTVWFASAEARAGKPAAFYAVTTST